ncbi:MAG: alpha/beta fold hydrolase [Pseudohongiella sp.]|uniref:alpha/beta fold hydrolase n=1 Tax=Pseudohongiella sp. TaxID=1979412 RepID=UPI0034A08819
MKLNFRQYSTDGEPLLILHGLLGNLANWTWHSRRLAEHFAVYGLDLRNHGSSPHEHDMSYSLMAQDVVEFMDDQGIGAAHVLGHSMGGKVAMQLAMDHPERIKRLVIADIAPVQYGGERGEHDEIFDGLSALDLDTLSSRTEANKQLAAWVEDEQVRQFLLSNLERDDDGGFAWRINLPALRDNYPALREKPAGDGVFDRDVLFIRGDLSDYITEAHPEETLRHFPRATIKTLMQAGHWLHAEKPETFNRLVLDFLSDKTSDNQQADS